MSIHSVQMLLPKHWDLLLLADPSKAMITSYISDADIFEYRAMQQVVGILVLRAIGEGILEIKNIAIREDFQNRKLAQALLQYAIDFATKHDYKTIEIGTGSTSFAQLYLYQKMGFRVDRICKDFFTSHYNDPIYENNLRLEDMVILQRILSTD